MSSGYFYAYALIAFLLSTCLLALVSTFLLFFFSLSLSFDPCRDTREHPSLESVLKSRPTNFSPSLKSPTTSQSECECKFLSLSLSQLPFHKLQEESFLSLAKRKKRTRESESGSQAGKRTAKDYD